MLSVAAGIGEVLVMAEMQGKARFRDLDAAEFQAADSVPLADRRPAVAARRSAAARPGVEHVPDESALGSGVLTLNRDAEAPAPAGHDAIGTGAGERFHDRLHDLVGRMAGAHRHRLAGIGPDDGA